MNHSANDSSPASENHAEIRLTRITARNPARLSKAFALIGNVLVKEGGGNMRDGVAERLTVNHLADFAALLPTLKPMQALLYGANVHGVARVVTNDRLEKARTEGSDLPIIARTRDHFHWPDGPGILMVDYDPAPDGPALEMTPLRDALAATCLPLASAPAVWRPSASSCIYSSDGTELRPIAGQRFYFPVRDASDIPRAGQVLFDRLWLAGYGRYELSKSGAFLMRSVIDASVFQPERLDFCGGAALGKGLVQKLPDPVLFNPDAPYLDTRAALPDLTADEQARIDDLRSEYKAALVDEQARIREAWIAERVAERLAKVAEPLQEQFRPKLETAYRQAAEGGWLDPDFELTVKVKGGKTRKILTVGELLRNRADYHEATTLDPLEPTYPDGQARLVGWLNLNARPPYLQSQAHGGTRYFLGVEPVAVDVDAPEMDEGYWESLLGDADVGVKPVGASTAKPLITRNEANKEVLVSQQEAAAILQEIEFQNLLRFDPIEQDWLHYQPDTGIFVKRPALVSESAVYRAIRKYSENHPFGAAYVSGVARCLVWESVKEITPTPGKICFKNGVLDLSTLEFLPHSPEYQFTASLPFDWTPDAPEPQPIIDWLMESVDGHTDQVQLLRAFLKASLVGRADLQRFLELVGPGGSGKGTFIRLLLALLGRDAVHSTTLDQLEKNRFETAKLFGKKLVVITDAERWHGDVSMFKSITGQDPIRFEEKHKQAGASFTYTGMVLIAANQHTESTDYSSGIQRRRITVGFDHVVPAHARRDLDAEFEPYLPALAKWALAMPDSDVTAYLRSTSVHVDSLRQARIDALVATNPIAAWLLDNCAFDPGATSPVGVKRKVVISSGIGDGDHETESRVMYENSDVWLYPNYVLWCEQHGKNPLAHNVFTGALIDVGKNVLGQEVEKLRPKRDGVKVRGIRLLSEPNPASGMACDELVMNCDELVMDYPIDVVELGELSKNSVVVEKTAGNQQQSSTTGESLSEKLGDIGEKVGDGGEVHHLQRHQQLSPSQFTAEFTTVHHSSPQSSPLPPADDFISHPSPAQPATPPVDADPIAPPRPVRSADAGALAAVLNHYRGWAMPEELAKKSGLGGTTRVMVAAQELAAAGRALIQGGMVKPAGVEGRP